MKKTVIIMAKFRISGGLTILGIDAESGEKLRLLPDENSASAKEKATARPIPYDDAKYSGGNGSRGEAEVLDKIEIEITEQLAGGINGTSLYRNELRLYDSSKPWVKIGAVGLDEAVKLMKSDAPRTVLGSKSYKIDDIGEFSGESWELLRLNIAKITVGTYPNSQNKKCSVEFSYNDHTYKFFDLKDPQLTDQYRKRECGDYPLEEQQHYAVVALQDGKPEKPTAYKNVVQIF